MSEAYIRINGNILTTAQSTTVRVAISTMALEMSKRNALGKDGEAIRKLYVARIKEVLEYIGAGL